MLKKDQQVKLVKPDTMTFNIILDGCVRFKSSLKGQQVLELMSEIGVTADAHSITLIGQIHEMNGLRDEIKKLKYHIDRLPVPFLCRYQQIYNSLLNLHFKFDDIDAAAHLILDMHITRVSATLHEKCGRESQKPHLVSIGSDSIRSGLKMQILPELFVKDSILQSQTELELVIFKNGKILLRTRALAKLVGGCRRHGRINKLSEVLYSIQEDYHHKQEGFSLCSEVIEACVHLGWLEAAHDILDDMEKLGGRSMSLTTYMILLKAYYGKQMLKQGNALLRRMRKLDWLVDVSNEVVASSCSSETSGVPYSSSKCTSGLAEFLFQEASEDRGMSPTVYELNSTIYFFCKATMMEDTLKTYRKMGHMEIRPTLQTFAHLVHGYSSLGMYRDITILWGDIKRSMEESNFALCRDMYECLLLNFLRGGYCERVMEIVEYMKKQNMYADRWMYRCEFLKLPKNLYTSLKAFETRNDTQKKRLQYVAAFRKWAGVL